jgi:hypothetical protein
MLNSAGGGRVNRNLVSELIVTALMTATLEILVPAHPIASAAAIVGSWLLFQIVCAWSFMRALYSGDILEYSGPPNRYAPAPRARLSPYARRFLSSYLVAARPPPKTNSRTIV